MAARAYNDFPLTPHFRLREFECRCCRRVQLSTRLLLLLEDLRQHWGRPLVVTSGYRCDAHNRAVGGVPRSLHRAGQAADLSAGAEDQQRLAVIARFLGFEEVLPGGAKNYLHIGVKTLQV